MADKTRKRFGVLTFCGDLPQGAYHTSVVLKAVCGDTVDNGPDMKAGCDREALRKENEEMSKVNYQKRWVGQELDDDAVRKRFIRHLKRWHNEFTTPYWKSNFNDWLIYECTVRPCGLVVVSITEDFVTLYAHCAGVQTEGICLGATFKVPTDKFKTPDLVKMIGPYRYHKHGPAVRFEWFPRLDDPRIKSEYITELAWWYDGSEDKTV